MPQACHFNSQASATLQYHRHLQQVLAAQVALLFPREQSAFSKYGALKFH